MSRASGEPSLTLDLRWHEATLDAELSQRVDQLTDRLRGKRHQPGEPATANANGGNGLAWFRPSSSVKPVALQPDRRT